MLGIWALVIAMSSIVQLGNLGMAGSLVKYVAKYDALNDVCSMSSTIQTAVISGGLSSLVFTIIAYPAAREYLKLVMNPELYPFALEVLPYALAAFWISMLTRIYQSALYGCHLIARRNGVLIGDSIAYPVFCFFVIPSYGLPGLAFCRLVVNCATFTATLILLRKRIPGLPVVPCRWDKGLFQEMIGYALNFEIISIFAVLCDPVTKGFLSRFGSVTMVGYFDMASKVVQQLRSLFVNACQVLIPAFANLKEIEPHRIAAAYLKSYRVLFYISLPVFSVFAVSMPLVSVAWIGSYQPIFVWSGVILMGGWFFNTLGIPANYAYLGQGDMKWNVISHFVMSILNIILGVILAEVLGGLGVVTAWALSLFFGGIIQNISYIFKNDIAFGEIFPASSRPLALFCALGAGLSYAACHAGLSFCGSPVWSGVMISFFGATILIPSWVHPLRKECLSWLSMVVAKEPAT